MYNTECNLHSINQNIILFRYIIMIALSVNFCAFSCSHLRWKKGLPFALLSYQQREHASFIIKTNSKLSSRYSLIRSVFCALKNHFALFISLNSYSNISLDLDKDSDSDTDIGSDMDSDTDSDKLKILFRTRDFFGPRTRTKS